MFKPTQEQKDNLALLKTGSDVKIVAGAGSGKAQPLDELVLTPTGYTTMGNIQIGDLVISDRGLPIQVLQVYNHTDLNMYRLTFSDGSTVDSCEDHLWEVKELNWKTGVRRQETVVRTLKELLPRIQKEKKSKKPYPYSVRLPQPIAFNRACLAVEPYLMGYTLGNGSSSISYLKNACSIYDYDEIVANIDDSVILSTYVNKNVKYFNLKQHIRNLYNLYGLECVKSLDKWIPEDYLIGSVEQRIALLQGLMDSDGSCTKNRASYSSSSLKLAKGVEQLVRSLGGTASISTAYRLDKGADANTEYHVSVRTPFNPFRLKRKADSYTVIGTDIRGDKRIVSATYLGKQDGKCILVDSPSQLYITRDYTITHNSSSLRYMAASMPHKTFLVWCFNAANALESNNHPDKPDNIVYSTGHSTAYREMVDAKMRKKLGPFLNYNELPISDGDIEGILGKMDKDFDKNCMVIRRAMLDCVVQFCRSDKEDIGLFSMNYYNYIFSKLAEVEGTLELNLGARALLSERTAFYWAYLTDANKDTQITHDVYLKMYQLSGTVVSEVWDKVGKRFIKPDIICMDESQDLNPVMESIFSIQPHQKLLIGDPYQQLYAWRGAGNAMNNFNDFAIGYLTESFRFNSTIADMANLVLAKAGSDMVVKGSSTKTEITSYAHLCRTNASVVARIFAELGTGRKVYTSIKVSDVFSKLYHMQSCWYNEKPKYPSKELASVVDKESLIKALEYSEELQRLNRLSAHLTADGNTLTGAKKRLDSILVKTPGEADIVISTIHFSKGMEWDYVSIDDDFLVIGEEESIEEALERLWDSEPLYCMCYVAITRARVECIVPWYLEDIFKVKEPFDKTSTIYY